jgi:hypothetical protein
MREIGEMEPIRNQSLQNAEIEKDKAASNDSEFDRHPKGHRLLSE